MKIIVGLGNSGKKYEGTRHNAGFMVLGRIAAHKKVAGVEGPIEFSKKSKLDASIAVKDVKGESIILAKPETFMNLSGEAVSKLLNYFHTGVEDLIVICDDIDIPLGQARIRHQGGSAGQKGLQNIIDELSTEEFTRVRVGICGNEKVNKECDKESEIDTKEFVLDKFADRELPIINDMAEEVADHLVSFFGGKEPIKATTLQVV